MFLNDWDDFSQLAGSCPSGGFFGRGGSSFCAPGVAGMLGFEIFGAQRQGVRGFGRTRGTRWCSGFEIFTARRQGVEILGGGLEKSNKKSTI